MTKAKWKTNLLVPVAVSLLCVMLASCGRRGPLEQPGAKGAQTAPAEIEKTEIGKPTTLDGAGTTNKVRTSAPKEPFFLDSLL